MFEISFLNKNGKETIFPQQFDLLHENMSRIDSTGNNPEEVFAAQADVRNYRENTGCGEIFRM